MFLIGDYKEPNYCTEISLTQVLSIYDSKHGKYGFLRIFNCNFTTMVSSEVEVRFLSSLDHFWPDQSNTLSKVALVFEKMHKAFKNKAQGYCTLLTESNFKLESNHSAIFGKSDSFLCLIRYKNAVTKVMPVVSFKGWVEEKL